MAEKKKLSRTMPLPGRSAARALEARLGKLTLGSTLRAIREGEELSLTAFAAKLGITAAKLCDIEKGRRHVSPERAARWAEELGYSPEQFVRLALQAELDQAGLAFTVHVSPSR